MSGGSPMAHGPDPLGRDEIVAHASFVRGVAQALLADAAAADDVAQETLLKLLKAAASRSLAPRSLRGWLARSVRNLAIQWRLADVRRATREEGGARPEALPATDALVQRMELHRRVVDATLALDSGLRAVVLLHYFDELPMAAVAQRLGVPLETARTRLKRALERLRARFEAEEGGARQLLLALLPVAGVEIPPATIAVATGAVATTAAGGFVAGTLVTSLGAPLVMTTVGKLSLAVAPLLAVGAWWLLHEAPLDPSHATSRASAVERLQTPEPAAADAGTHAAAAREADLPAVATEATSGIDPVLAAAGLGTVRVHVVAGAERASVANVGVRVMPETELRAIARSVRGNTDADGVFVATGVRAGACVAALAGFAAPLSTAFDLAPGRTRDVELLLFESKRPDDAFLGVDGRVVDANDLPIAGASI